jgi:antitoxin ParD1/3/4
MAMVKKSITVTAQQDKWIRAQMETGNYATDSEVIREALREKEMRAREIEYIRAKLIAAEQSGFTDLSRDEILQKSKEELRKNGEL